MGEWKVRYYTYYRVKPVFVDSKSPESGYTAKRSIQVIISK